MHSPLDGDEAAFAAQLPKLAEDAAFCAAIGCRSFQLVLRATTGGPTKEERWKLVRGRLAAIGEVLGKHDVRLGLEFLGPLVFRTRVGGGRGRGGASAADPNAPPPPPPSPPVPFIWTLPETVKPCPKSAGRIWASCSTPGTGTIPAVPFRDPGRGIRIVHVHVSDARQTARRSPRQQRVMPGEGSVDVLGFFRALGKAGYPGGVGPETIGPRILKERRPRRARLGLETTKAVMKKAGVLA